MNILNNAVEAIPADQDGSIVVYTRQTEDMVHIGIKDSGMGIPEDVLQHIFEPFFTYRLNII